MVEKRSRGRPKGSKTHSHPVVDQVEPRCVKCGSTFRSSFVGTPRYISANGVYEGQHYTRIVFRRCKCLTCGQYRVQRSFENYPAVER